MSGSWYRLALSAVILVAFGGAVSTSGQTATPPGQINVQDMTITDLVVAAERLREAGRTDEAVQLLGVVLSRDRDNKEAHGMLGDIYWESGEPLKAREEWEAVRKLHPNDFGANFGLGRLKLNSRSYRDVMYYLEIAERVAPPDRLAEVLVPLAQAYGQSSEYEKAKDAIRRAIAKEPDNYEAQYVLTGIASLSAQQSEDFDQADIEAQRLINLADEKLKVDGVTLEGAQRLYGAYEMRLNVLRGYHAVLFQFNADGTRSDKPVEEFREQLASVVSRVVETMLKREDARRTLSYFDVVDFAKKAVEFDRGTNKDSLLTLARLQERTGDIAGAVESFGRLLEIDPENQAAIRALETLPPSAAEAMEPPASAPTPAGE